MAAQDLPQLRKKGSENLKTGCAKFQVHGTSQFHANRLDNPKEAVNKYQKYCVLEVIEEFNKVI